MCITMFVYWIFLTPKKISVLSSFNLMIVFIIMDVMFHEDTMYFFSESELQGEYHQEIQTLDYDYHISEEGVSEQPEPMNQKVGELEVSGIILEPNSDKHPEADEIT